LTSVAPGQTSAEKKFKVDALHDAFQTTSWTAIQGLHPDQIHEGYDKIKEKLLDAGVIVYNADQTIATVKKIEPANDPKIDEEVKEKVKKSAVKKK
jgi:hypothetical protein